MPDTCKVTWRVDGCTERCLLAPGHGGAVHKSEHHVYWPLPGPGIDLAGKRITGHITPIPKEGTQ